ncbi:hypothetical protein KIN20_018205 [Parelaphostrongylus tenuis]|uniref:Uncharacterized protein n=1 Tax=Parelaphostrongylus tenuis TaxID=148309 RepID=A0AAD5N3C9_PARTN|nr:hypothetical protein KIN20_018205 [Parelaphostrongylus tenuis]
MQPCALLKQDAVAVTSTGSNCNNSDAHISACVNRLSGWQQVPVNRSGHIKGRVSLKKVRLTEKILICES